MTYLSRAVEGLRVVTPLCYKVVDQNELSVMKSRVYNELLTLEKIYTEATKVFNG